MMVNMIFTYSSNFLFYNYCKQLLQCIANSDSESSGERHVPNESELITSQRLETYISLAETERQRVQSIFSNVNVDTEDCSLGRGDDAAEFVVVDGERPGLALLLGFEHFDIGEPRPGVVKDLSNMYELFHTHLGFEVQEKKDLTVAQCVDWLKTGKGCTLQGLFGNY